MPRQLKKDHSIVEVLEPKNERSFLTINDITQKKMFDFKDVKTKLIVALVALFVGSAAFGFSYYKEVVGLRENPQKIAQEEVGKTVAKVSAHMLLPEGETPTVATVTDTETLKKQPFFANANVGDRVLIYASALKAILYRPELDKIIEVAPLNIGNRQ